MLPAGAAEGDRGVVRVPRMQMRDNDDAIELTAELPGIEPDKVKVELEDDTLTISGEAEAKEEREDARIERYVGFYRQIPLPDSVDADQAQASYNNGVLTIRFPKRAERSNAKQIPVTTIIKGAGHGPHRQVSRHLGHPRRHRGNLRPAPGQHGEGLHRRRRGHRRHSRPRPLHAARHRRRVRRVGGHLSRRRQGSARRLSEGRHLHPSATLHDREPQRRPPRAARRPDRHRRLQPPHDAQRHQLRHVGRDRASH
ncbi:MAG: hypothetical protein DME13_08715 [Candidatus Rokuibacteriota bacterium]|nr:MAG: hypothetical protein DME13_08715 [Candidatus Rokubacteria bacterium]